MPHSKKNDDYKRHQQNSKKAAARNTIVALAALGTTLGTTFIVFAPIVFTSILPSIVGKIIQHTRKQGRPANFMRVSRAVIVPI